VSARERLSQKMSRVAASMDRPSRRVRRWRKHGTLGRCRRVRGAEELGLYDVWGGAQFGDATSYLQHFTAPLNWALY
jgi:hypothetical protein